MRAYLSSVFIFVALIGQSQAFLQEKLALLKSLKSGFEGGFGSGGGGGYGGGYGGSYGGGGFGGSSGGYNYPAPSRPLYSGGESYGRSSYYNTGNAGGEQVIKVIKVIVPAQQNSYDSSSYAGASTYSSGGGYASSWAPAPQPQVIAPQPVQISQPTPVQYSVQVAPPAPVQYREPQLPPVQAAPIVFRNPQPAPVQVQQSVELPQPVQYTAPQPAAYQVQYTAPQPQPASYQYSAPQQVVSTQQVVQPQPVAVTSTTYQQPQTVVKTLKLVVSEEGNGQVASYAPVAESTGYGSGYGANSATWSQGQNNIGGSLWGKGWQRGGIWQKLGC